MRESEEEEIRFHAQYHMDVEKRSLEMRHNLAARRIQRLFRQYAKHIKTHYAGKAKKGKKSEGGTKKGAKKGK